MKQKRNKTGYAALKLRIAIVAIIVLSTAGLGYDYWERTSNASVFVLVGFIIFSLSTVILYSPIKVRHNGFEKNV